MTTSAARVSPKRKHPFKSAIGAPLVALVLLVSGFSPASAADKPFTDRVLRLSDWTGKTFFEFMMNKDGLKDALDADLTHPIDLADLKKVKKIAKDSFDPQVFRKILGYFRGGEKGFDALFAQLEKDIAAGKKITPESIVGELRSILTTKGLLQDAKMGGLAPLVIAPFVTMASGGGTTVIIDDLNFFLNYGYLLGRKGDSKEEIAKALKSGRNFGYSGEEKLLDFSDTYFLKKLDAYLGEEKDSAKLWRAIMDVLTASDPSGIKSLSKKGQTVATGFLTIYAAELRRHAMVDFANSAHPWENDLAEAMFASVFVHRNGGFLFGDKTVRSGKPKIVKGTPANFFGVGTQGSGIGVNRRERRALQTLLTEALEEHYPDEVAEVRKLIGLERGDIVRGMMEFINNPKNQNLVRQNSERIGKSFGKIMAAIHDDSPKLLAYFTSPGAGIPVLKAKFKSTICRGILQE